MSTTSMGTTSRARHSRASFRHSREGGNLARCRGGSRTAPASRHDVLTRHAAKVTPILTFPHRGGRNALPRHRVQDHLAGDLVGGDEAEGVGGVREREDAVDQDAVAALRDATEGGGSEIVRLGA